jgi:hypothetical protein
VTWQRNERRRAGPSLAKEGHESCLALGDHEAHHSYCMYERSHQDPIDDLSLDEARLFSQHICVPAAIFKGRCEGLPNPAAPQGVVAFIYNVTGLRLAGISFKCLRFLVISFMGSGD